MKLSRFLLPALATCLLTVPTVQVHAHPSAATAAPAKKPAGIQRIDPTFWWVGMKNPKLQLLVHNPGIADSKLTMAAYPGVTLEGTQKLESPNYLLVNLNIAPDAKPGKLKLEFVGGKNKLKYDYELRARNTDKSRVQGINSSDFIYFLMPDRFANGDPKNDIIKTARARTVARDSMYARHGGDYKGIEQHFDYLKSLGVTAIWPTPVTENDMPKASYHGYAVTDYYNSDTRYGTTEEYAQFVQKAHQNGLKVIHDVVLNHMGSYNYLFIDQPAKDWFNQWPAFTRSNYNSLALNDPYGSARDRDLYNKGWFDTTMPDVNQSNPLVSTYLIQNFLWWVEYTGLDGYRIDTYPYSDPKFLMDWGKALLDEYPQLGMFGEAWVGSTAQQAFFARNILPPVDGFKSNLPGVLDFQSQNAAWDALKEKGNVYKFYEALQGDWLYEDASRNVVFLDNHDMSRVYSVIGESLPRLKMGFAWLLTTRGIPQLYYGTEILMKNFSNPDGLVRSDFPGGFSGDKQNKFTAAGRTPQEQEAFAYVSKLGTYRKSHPVLQTGKLMQFIPQDGIYTYFRYNEQGETVMVMLNSNQEEKTVDGSRFSERLNGFTSGTEVVSGAAVTDLKSFKVPGWSALVVELRK
ncbi:glycoside hydrolase family 13 protein [Hymenobacter sp. BT186]|uniref:Glycoside hydrolase family 13 protein n=1 Tax=Hymenobacter telluris TaxID=2816474 RepID=A0A939EYC2_9BACT|nr:glycoside hydrolase family 13 protein [Hymenobacter telluris]MBO0359703.1 glycoside hydrolase family 13 protein [Hymenobacter telluris]MBW3375730.1 glycoside hydrolase family 13 protein [Hymenobacter norwichensis]